MVIPVVHGKELQKVRKIYSKIYPQKFTLKIYRQKSPKIHSRLNLIILDGANNEVPSLLNHPKIEEIAKKHGKATGHVLLRFQIQRGVIVLTKSVNPDRIKEQILIDAIR